MILSEPNIGTSCHLSSPPNTFQPSPLFSLVYIQADMKAGTGTEERRYKNLLGINEAEFILYKGKPRYVVPISSRTNDANVYHYSKCDAQVPAKSTQK